MTVRTGRPMPSGAEVSGGTFAKPGPVAPGQVGQRLRCPRPEADEWADPGLVLTSAPGNRIDPRNVLRWWDEVCEREEIPHPRVHDLRHTAASLLFSAGVDLNVVIVPGCGT
ncbi:Phage integrase family protein [Parafrankia irregularis]|uniref:Phage integrase family protein n=1 Tax=Parafrankia irregularis TaxID=795642 RepID=A0A0S4QFE3_9ACTN|nr:MULTISPECIES: tyrosine-type recombinase/integrase [Parafrankia]CUU54119.1 Phage integrase family protein [Parafrankia irregularis]